MFNPETSCISPKSIIANVVFSILIHNAIRKWFDPDRDWDSRWNIRDVRRGCTYGLSSIWRGSASAQPRTAPTPLSSSGWQRCTACARRVQVSIDRRVEMQQGRAAGERRTGERKRAEAVNVADKCARTARHRREKRDDKGRGSKCVRRVIAGNLGRPLPDDRVQTGAEQQATCRFHGSGY